MSLVAVVIPTYNEAENIGRVLESLLDVARRYRLEIRVLVVDDNSSDGTVEIVEGFQARSGSVSMLRRPGKMGLGSAYVDGFRWCLRNLEGLAVVVEMDADGSHDPSQLPLLVEPILNGVADVVIGSRYVAGGGWRGGSLERRIISRGANLLTRISTGMKVKDATSGYRAIAGTIIEKVFSREQCFESGYIFQVETLFSYHKLGARIMEAPIDFYERGGGKSKLNFRELVMFAEWCLRQFFSRIKTGFT
ncbi:MAG: polyprenol monophosphomannose synthase [Nitrososphaerota archaeon]